MPFLSRMAAKTKTNTYINTAEGQFSTTQPSHRNGVFHCFGRDVFVSCSAAEQACSFPHYSLHKKCIFFPCLAAISFTTQPLSARTFPNLQAAFSQSQFQEAFPAPWPDNALTFQLTYSNLTAALLLVYCGAK